MDTKSILSALRAGADVDAALKCLSNFDDPMSERESAVVTAYLKQRKEAIETDSKPAPPSEQVSKLLAKPVALIPRSIVFSCIVFSLRLHNVSYNAKHSLVARLLPQLFISTKARQQRRAAVAAYMARKVEGGAEKSKLEMIDAAKVEEALGVVSPAEWCAAAAMLTEKGAWHDRGFLRCVQELLANTAAASLSQEFAEGIKASWVQLLGTFLLAVAQSRVIRNTKDTRSADAQVDAKTGKASFLGCSNVASFIRRMRNNAFALSALASFPASGKAAFPCALVASHLSSEQKEVSKDSLVESVKSFPGTISRVLGMAPPAGTIISSEADAALQYCFYTLGLSSTSVAQSRDILALMQSLPADTMRSYFDRFQSDILYQLVNPFVNNAAVFAPARVFEVSSAIARALTNATEPIITEKSWDVICSTLQGALQNRCRSGPDRVGVVGVLAAILKAQRRNGHSLPSPQAAFGAVRSNIESGESDLMGFCWDVLAAVPGGCDAAKGHALLKNFYKNDESRHMCLLHASHEDFTIANDTWVEFQKDSIETEVFRPDAFLSYGFAHSDADLKSHSALCASAESLSQLATVERVRAAHVAVRLAESGASYDGLAMLLTDAAGSVRRVCVEFIKANKDNTALLIGTWAALSANVFAITSKTSESVKALGNAGEALIVVATLLLSVPEQLTVSTLADVLLCCGHDHVVGHDAYYFHPLDCVLDRMRTSSLECPKAVFDKIFDVHSRALDTNLSEVATILCSRLDGSAHVASAAGRALALILGNYSVKRSGEEAARVGSAVRCIFDAVLIQLQAAVEYFNAQPELDAAISANDPLIMDGYITKQLKALGHLKEYPAKLPKGVTEEDMEDQKRRDAKLMVEAREKLNKEVAKRRSQISEQVRSYVSPFLALRTIGFVAPSAIEGLPTIYPFIHATLVSDKTAPSIVNFARDACQGLLFHSPLRQIASHFVSVSARLTSPTVVALSADDVAQVVSLATNLRQNCGLRLSTALFAVIQPFTKAAFKSGRSKTAKFIPVQTQHMLLAVVAMCTSQSDLPFKSEAVSLYLNILAGFPTLYKTVLSGLNILVQQIPAGATLPMIRGVFIGNDLQKECSILALGKFAGFDEFRRGLNVIACIANDASFSASKEATRILAERTYEMVESDMADFVSLLKDFGPLNPASAKKISATLVQLVTKFPTVQAELVPQLMKIGGVTAVGAIEALAPLLSTETVVMALGYLTDLVEDAKSSEDTLLKVLGAGRTILAVSSKSVIEAIAPGIQPRLKKAAPKAFTTEQKEMFCAIAVVWLTLIACKLDDVAFLEATVEQQATVLNTSNSAMVHGFVQESMAEIARHRLMKKHDKLAAFASNCLSQALSATVYSRKRAFASGFVGVVQGLGVRAIRQFDVLPLLEQACRDKQAPRSGAMLVLECLATALGRVFEPYALTMIQPLLDATAEKDSKIAGCADDASKAVMRTMSEAGLRQLIPKLVSGLQSDQTKKRTPALSFISYVAFCSPTQLAHTLPMIMTHICECLHDANSSVSNTAFTALKRVAGVVTNKEIQDHVDLILGAMRNPEVEMEAALDGLLYTRFMNTIDPASLALVAPVVARGLTERAPENKSKASQIVASISILVADPRSLVPYSEDLLRRLQQVVQGPQNDVRSTSSKAIAALAKALGGSFLEQAFDWCFTLLGRATTSAEKAGAAQAIVEIVHACGRHLLVGAVDAIDEGVRHENANVRDGYLHIMVYAPSTLAQEVFQDFLTVAFPWVLVGLSDSDERVRTTALTAGSNIIGLYGTRNLLMVLKPLLDGVISEDSNQRHSSMLLLSKLVIYLVTQIKKKFNIAAPVEEEGAAPEEGAEETDETSELLHAGEVKLETARDAEKRGVSILGQLEEELGAENFTRVLAALYLGRSETDSNVRTEVTVAWSIAVANIRAGVVKAFPAMVPMLVKFASSDEPDAAELALSAIEYTCARLAENIERFIKGFAEQYKIGDKAHIVGALVCMTEVIPHASGADVMALGGDIIPCVLPSLQSEDKDIRTSAGILFERVSKKVGPKLIESVVEKQMESSLLGVLEVVKVRPAESLKIIFRILGRDAHRLNQPDGVLDPYQFTPANMELITELLDIEEAEEEIFKYYEVIVMIILTATIQECEGATDAMTTFSQTLVDPYTQVPLSHLRLAFKNPVTKLGALRAAGAYALGIDLEDVEALNELFRFIISALSDTNDEISTTAAELLITLCKELDERVLDELLDDDVGRDSPEARAAPGKFSLNFLDTFHLILNATAHSIVSDDEPALAILSHPKLFETIQNFFLRVLDHGLPAQRALAVDSLADVLHYTPRATVSASVHTISGKCSKALFTKQDGTVVAAILRLCLLLLSFPANGKERIIESALAVTMMSALLCESTEARVLAHRTIVTILQRNPIQTAMVLGSIASKKAQMDTPLLKGAVCRFLSVVIRHGKCAEKKVEQCNAMLTMIKPWWETPETSSLGAAAGSAVGSLCMNPAVSDDEVNAIAEKAIAMATARSSTSIGGISAIYSLLLSCSHRLADGVRKQMASTIANAIGFCESDRMAAIWATRCIAVMARDEVIKPAIAVASVSRLFNRIGENDELALSTAKHLRDIIPTAGADIESCYPEMSSAWIDTGFFDADIDDESQSATFY